MRGGGWVQAPRQPGCGGMKPPPSPAEAFKYGRGPWIRAAAGGECGGYGLEVRLCPSERDPSGRRAPALEVGKRGSPRDAPFSRPGYARGPGLAAGLPIASPWSPFRAQRNRVRPLQEVGPGGLLICNLCVIRPVLILPILRLETNKVFPPLWKAKYPHSRPKEGVHSVGPNRRLKVLSVLC